MPSIGPRYKANLKEKMHVCHFTSAIGAKLFRPNAETGSQLAAQLNSH
jgi:dihydroorotase-like cyclic amidohydrolase